MDLRQCLGAVRRSWWLVLATVVAVMALASVWTWLAVPEYATSVTFFVTTPGRGEADSYQAGLFAMQRVRSYADLLASDRLSRSIAAHPDVTLTADQVRARITAVTPPDTVLLLAVVTDSDVVRSERVARALASEFVALVAELEAPGVGGAPDVAVTVVSGPVVNPVPVSPQPGRNVAVASVIGLLVGAAGAVGRELLDTTVRGAEALGAVTGVPVLAVVPYDARAARSPLVLTDDPRCARVEAFRHLRTNLRFVEADRSAGVMVVTSALPEEGKSTTAVNLAIASAESGRRTLLIDADLRRPRAAAYLGLEDAVGLSNVLAGQVLVRQALQPWGRHQLEVLASGSIPPNPSELLGSRAMTDLLGQLRRQFDVIVIDTSPLLPVTDAAVLAAAADGALLVARSGRTSQTQILTALASLRAVQARVLGCVLTMQRARRGQDAYDADRPRPARHRRHRTARTEAIARPGPTPARPVYPPRHAVRNPSADRPGSAGSDPVWDATGVS